MDTSSLSYRMTLRLWKEEKAFGPGIAALMEQVEVYASLNKAAASMGMAYSKAWRIIKEAEELMGISLMDRRTGGSGGGGASLTKEGKELLETYQDFVSEVDIEVDRIFNKYFK